MKTEATRVLATQSRWVHTHRNADIIQREPCDDGEALVLQDGKFFAYITTDRNGNIIGERQEKR